MYKAKKDHVVMIKSNRWWPFDPDVKGLYNASILVYVSLPLQLPYSFRYPNAIGHYVVDIVPNDDK